MATETDETIGAGPYAGLSSDQLVALLEKRDRQKKLGLVWERDEIEADRAVDADFVAAELLTELSDPPAGGSGWPNLVIEGDNFDALRWLRMTLSGRVKCIYVDPPYNTGARDWVYNDNYMKKEDRWRHSTWLEFLHRRFTLARDLLTEDGVMLVSINDENRAKFELLLDEVMPGMRVGSLVWRTRSGGNEGGEYFFSDNHEHVLVYGSPGFRFGGTEKSLSIYKNPDNDARGAWTSGDLTTNVSYTDKRAGKGYYPLHDPSTDIFYPPNPDAVWRFASIAASGPNARIKSSFIEDLIADGRVVFPSDQRMVRFESRDELDAAIAGGDVPRSGSAPLLRPDLPNLDFWIGKNIGFGTPRLKRFLSGMKRSTQPLSSWVVSKKEQKKLAANENSVLAGTNDEGSRDLKDIFQTKAFNYPKPPSLIRGLLEQSTSAGDLILDFFAGSATTAQAVMQLNAEDGGERRFVMVSSTEATIDEPGKNLCNDVTAERVRRLNAASDSSYAALIAPFAYLRTHSVRFEDVDYELTPAEAWTALEALHGLSLTPWNAARGWAAHESEDVVLVFADYVEPALLDAVRALAARRAPAFVYAWAPGPLQDALGPMDLEVRAVRETLVSRFRA